MMSSSDLLSSFCHTWNHQCIQLRNATRRFAREMVPTSSTSYDDSCPKRNIFPLLWCFHFQKETFSPSYYTSKSKKRQGFRTRRTFQDTFLTPSPTPSALNSTNSSHPLVTRFSLLQNCKHYKKSSHPANVIEYSLFVTLGKDSHPTMIRKLAVTQNLSVCCSLQLSCGHSMTVKGCDDFL